MDRKEIENTEKEVDEFIAEFTRKEDASELVDFIERENSIIQKIYITYDNFLKNSPKLMDAEQCYNWVFKQRIKIHKIFCEKMPILSQKRDEDIKN